MASININIDGININFIVNDGYHSLWMNYHVTKHIIQNNENEGFNSVLKIGTDEIKQIKSIQVEKFKCTVNDNTPLDQSCKQCSFVDKCHSTLKPIIKRYSEMIAESLMNDEANATHAHYDQKRTSTSTKLSGYILVIDKYGSSIIALKKKNIYKVMTCYRNAQFSNLSDIELAFKKVMGDFEWIRRLNIDQWNKRLTYKKFKNVVKHLPDNWI